MTHPGSWPSPLTAATVAAGGVALGPVALSDGGRTAWWTEMRPAEGGRSTVLRRTDDRPAVEVLPAGLDARSRVHEYGGRSWLPLGPGGGLVTSDRFDQRLWHVDDDGEARALTAATGAADRYADPVALPGGTHVLCVRERLATAVGTAVGTAVTHALVAVPLDGSGEVVELWTGSDFVAGAAVSPDGRRLAFLTWDHPRMPWDGTQLQVAELLPGPGLGPAVAVLGGDEESVLAPTWDGAGALVAATDRSGWWNLHRVPAAGGEPVPLWPVEQECGGPLWVLGARSHVPLPGGRTAVLHGGALAVLDADGAAHDVLAGSTWSPWLAADSDVVLGLAWTPTTRPRVLAVDTLTGDVREVAGPEQPDPDWVPVPERLTVPSAEGRSTPAVLYPPTSPLASLPPGVAPPAVLFVHGGPTSSAPVQFRPEIAYFTSRGLAVVDVDHGGSTGYGRAYRELLRGRWGEVDVEDCEAVARALVASGRASSVAIRGGSAGGWTVLSALTREGSPFAAGCSYYGVADLRAMGESTHDFESRYLDGLVPPEQWDERSPLARVDRLERPVLLLQGLDDPVVPPAQAERFAAALAGTGVPHALVLFAGEAHGFRRAETVVAALESELSFYAQVMGFDPPDVPQLALQRSTVS